MMGIIMRYGRITKVMLADNCERRYEAVDGLEAAISIDTYAFITGLDLRFSIVDLIMELHDE